ncbi:hypothetical protein Tco_0621363, partial [Tanacetum coccineum]
MDILPANLGADDYGISSMSMLWSGEKDIFNR